MSATQFYVPMPEDVPLVTARPFQPEQLQLIGRADPERLATEWGTTNLALRLLNLLGPSPSLRKLWLVGAAYIHLGDEVLGGPVSEQMERIADGVSPQTLTTVVDNLEQQFGTSGELQDGHRSFLTLVRSLVIDPEHNIAWLVHFFTYGTVDTPPVIRELFPNPFSPLRFESKWRTRDVLALARGIYDEKAFDRMPILADALQDAGCDNDHLLAHCRDEKLVHVRGCWAVDLCLGLD